MRILYLASARIPTPRAYGLQILETCAAFARSGAEIELVVPSRRAGKTAEDPFAFYGLKKNFSFLRLNVPDALFLGPVGFFFSLLWFAERARFLKTFWDADIVYSRDALVLLQYVLLGRKLVFEAHAGPNAVSAFVARRVHRLVVISQGLRSAYIARGVSPEKIITAPDGVDIAAFDIPDSREEARRALGFSLESPLVLYAGHLYARKGAGTLAAAALSMPDIVCAFLGGTEGDIAEFKSAWGASPNVKILGRVPHGDIPKYLRAADVLVLPNSSKDPDSSLYTSPMKLFEYMASGTPIVASDVPAVREVLDDSSAYFVTADSPESLRVAVAEALSRREGAHARARNALVKVRSYTWDERVGRIMASLHAE